MSDNPASVGLRVGPACRFYLGTHQTCWLDRTDVPLFVSRRRLAARKKLPRARGPWALDSGGFTELKLNGRWTVPPRLYAEEARRFRDHVGRMDFAATQDWMCEPFMLAKTGKTVREHQRLTTESYLTLRDLAPEIPWAPVLQGWRFDDYMQHAEDYREARVQLAAQPVVGIGSVCRRQATGEAEEVIRALHARGIALHGFGFKVKGLRRVAHYLASADSMAWSFRARSSPPLPSCEHASCANCMTFALRWRAHVVRTIPAHSQRALFGEEAVSVR